MTFEDGRTFAHRSIDVRDGKGTFLYGIHALQDVTLQQQTEKALREKNTLLERIFDNSHILIAYLDPQFNFLRVNTAYAAAEGKSPDFFIGKSHFELYPHAENEALFREVVKSRQPCHVRQRPFDYPGHPERGTTWWDWSLLPVQGESQELEGVLLILQDVTQQARALQGLRRRNRVYAVLKDCTHVILRSTDETELLQAFCDQLVNSGGFRLVWVGYARHDEQRSVEAMASAGDDNGYTRQVRITWADTERGRGPAGRAIRTGHSVVLRDTQSDPDFAPWRETAREHGYRSLLALPLRCSGDILGSLNLYSSDVDAFDDEEVELLSTLAEDLSYAIESLREKRARAEAEEMLQLRLQTIECTRNGVLIAEPGGAGVKIIYTNPAFSKITGYSSAEVLGQNPGFLHRDIATQAGLDVIRQAMRRGVSDSALVRNRRKDGSLYWNELHITPVRNRGGRITHWIGISNDVTEQIRYQEQLEYQSNHDTLTGLPNRNLLRDRLVQSIAYARRQQRVISVLWLDIDGLKLINDSFGHAEGDRVIQENARRLQEAAREGDTVARITGAEFAIILADVRHPDDVTPVCERLLTAVSQPLQVDDEWLKLSASIGISVYPDDAPDAETLLRYANIALHRSKEAGRNGFEYYQAAMNTEAMERLKLESQMRQALERDEFQLYYQPQIDLRTTHITGFEALIRWHHPTRGMVSPATFIPLAEECGLIVPLGWWVLKEACRQIKQWQREGLPTVTVAVNLSARQLEQPDIVQQIAKVLEEADVKPGCIALELTESAVMRNPETLLHRLQALRELGLSLAMDDFGTGYSSLSNLHRFPFNKIKIDQSFVKTLNSDPHNAAIVGAIIAMTHSLKLRTVAEGVEGEAQLRFLERLDCDELQGYYFSRPVPASEAGGMLRQPVPLFTPRTDEPTNRQTILVVDDDKIVARTLEEELKTEGYHILTANSGAEALDLLAIEQVQVIFSDHRMPSMTGVELLSRVSEIYPRIVRIMLTAHADIETVTSAVNSGHVQHILYKPWDSEQLRETARRAFMEARNSQG
jgi:diguanylate cyclase (GGDEF)-like protein/PAS domain S-box-containing protein